VNLLKHPRRAGRVRWNEGAPIGINNEGIPRLGLQPRSGSIRPDKLRRPSDPVTYGLIDKTSKLRYTYKVESSTVKGEAMGEAKVQDYEKLIQKKVSGKVADYHDYQDCCQVCRIRVWQSFGKYEIDEANGMSLRNWVTLQVDSAISNYLRDTYYTERARREVPYGLLSDMELLLGRYVPDEAGAIEEEEFFRGVGLEGGTSSGLFKRWTESRSHEETELKELEAEILKNLKPMQVEIYKMLKEGYTQREIAAGLDHGTVSQPYVHKQIQQIKKVVIKIMGRRELY